MNARKKRGVPAGEVMTRSPTGVSRLDRSSRSWWDTCTRRSAWPTSSCTSETPIRPASSRRATPISVKYFTRDSTAGS